MSHDKINVGDNMGIKPATQVIRPFAPENKSKVGTIGK